MLRFDSIEIHNLLSISHAKFDVVNGITAIFGLNGSGKSSILEAWHVGLTDESYKGISKGNLRNWVNNKNPWVIIIRGTLKGNKFMLRRAEDWNQFIEYLPDREEELKYENRQGFQEKIEEKFGFNKKILGHIAFLSNKTYKPYLNLSSGERRTLRDKFFNIEDFDQLEWRFKDKINEQETKIKDMEIEKDSFVQKINSLIEMKTNVNDVYAEQIETKKAAIIELEKEIQQTNIELMKNNLAAEQTKLKKISDRKKELESEVKTQTEEVFKLKTELTTITNAIQKQIDYANQKTDLESKILDVKTSINEAVYAEFNKCEANFNLKSDELTKLEKQLTVLENEIESLQSKIEVFEESIKSNKKIEKEIESLEQENASYSKDIELHQNFLKNPSTYQNQIDSIKQELSDALSKKTVIETKIHENEELKAFYEHSKECDKCKQGIPEQYIADMLEKIAFDLNVLDFQINDSCMFITKKNEELTKCVNLKASDDSERTRVAKVFSIVDSNNKLIESKKSYIKPNVEEQKQQLQKDLEKIDTAAIKADIVKISEEKRILAVSKQSYEDQVKIQNNLKTKLSLYNEQYSKLEVPTTSYDDTITTAINDKILKIENLKTEASTKIEKAEAGITTIETSIKEVEKLISAYDNSVVNLSKLKIELQDTETKQKASNEKSEAAIAAANQLLETRQENLFKERRQLQVLQIAHEFFHDKRGKKHVFVDLKQTIINERLPLINSFIKNFSNDFSFPYNITLKNGGLDADITYLGKTADFVNFSDGEQQKINIIILFAFLELRRMIHNQEFPLMFLDELTAPFDFEAIELFYDILGSLKTNIPIYTISHKGYREHEKIARFIDVHKENRFSKYIITQNK